MDSEERKRLLITLALQTRKDNIAEFLATAELPTSGTLADYRSVLEQNIGTKTLPITRVATWLDERAAHERQHVMLLKSTTGMAHEWRKQSTEHLKQLNERIPNSPGGLLLPSTPTLAAARLTPANLLEVNVLSLETAQTREPDLDYSSPRKDTDETVTFKAYVEERSRCVTIFKWNLQSGDAQLQITNLPSGSTYSTVWEQTADILGSIIPIRLFDKLDLDKVISRLHASAMLPDPEARPQSIDYASPQGRRLIGRVIATRQSLIGEQMIDDALEAMRQKGKARIGNFYWKPSQKTPFSDDIHTVIIAEEHRVNFPTDNPANVIEYILRRIRKLS